MRADDQERATEFLQQLYAAGQIDAARFDVGLTGLGSATPKAGIR